MLNLRLSPRTAATLNQRDLHGHVNAHYGFNTPTTVKGPFTLNVKVHLYVPVSVTVKFTLTDRMVHHNWHNRVFSKCTRMAIMPILASEALFRENKKIQLQNATLVSIEPWTSDSKSNMLLSTLIWHLLVKTETLSSLYCRALLIPLNHPCPNIKWCMNRSLKIS